MADEGLTELDNKTNQLKRITKKCSRNQTKSVINIGIDPTNGCIQEEEICRPKTQMNKRSSVLVANSPQKVDLSGHIGSELKQRVSTQNQLHSSHRRNLTQTFSKLRNQSVRNSGLLGQMIIDEAHEEGAKVAQKALAAAEKNRKQQTKLPSAAEFKRSVEDFKGRLRD